MRAAAFLTVLAVLVGTSCGCRSKSSGKPVLATKFPTAAYDTLTEAELTRFIALLPTFNAALKAAKWNTAPVDAEKGLLGALAPLVEGMNVPGLKDSLKANGSDWRTFRATLYKVFAARALVVISEHMTAELVAKMQNDTTLAIQKKYADYQNVKNAANEIPAANLELAKKYEKELEPIRSLGH